MDAHGSWFVKTLFQIDNCPTATPGNRHRSRPRRRRTRDPTARVPQTDHVGQRQTIREPRVSRPNDSNKNRAPEDATVFTSMQSGGNSQPHAEDDGGTICG